MKGTIQSFDGADGLGTIELEDGRQCRFGMSACKKVDPVPGTRVLVDDLSQARGSLHAGKVRAASWFSRPKKAFSGPRTKLLARFDQREPRGDLGVPAGFLMKWCIQNQLSAVPASADPELEQREHEVIAAVIAGNMSGRKFITEWCDEKPSSLNLSEEGLRFWLHYQEPMLLNLKTKFERDLMAVCGISFDQIFSLKEGGEMDQAIFDKISAAYAKWHRS